jgi:hypothetical protein
MPLYEWLVNPNPPPLKPAPISQAVLEFVVVEIFILDTNSFIRSGV